MQLWAIICLSLGLCSQASAQAQLSLQPDQTDGGKPAAALYGSWGTPEQCAAAEAGGIENPRLFPYVIDAEWIRQGHIHCYLTWREHYRTQAGLEVQAFAQCGEDSLREYRILLRLLGGKLQIRWSRDFATQALVSCD